MIYFFIFPLKIRKLLLGFKNVSIFKEFYSAAFLRHTTQFSHHLEWLPKKFWSFKLKGKRSEKISPRITTKSFQEKKKTFVGEKKNITMIFFFFSSITELIQFSAPILFCKIKYLNNIGKWSFFNKFSISKCKFLINQFNFNKLMCFWLINKCKIKVYNFFLKLFSDEK